MHHRFHAVLAALAALNAGSGPALPGQEPGLGDRRPGFCKRQWDSKTGLPQNTVKALQQSSDGYLWIGTLGGLCRFDGTTMRVFDVANTPELRGCRIDALHETPDGVLWIACERAGLTRFDHGRFTHLDGLPDSLTFTLGHDRGGRLHVGTTDGLFVLDGSTFRRIHPQLDLQITSLLLRRNGDLLVGSPRGIHRLTADGLEAVCSARVKCLAETADGSLWAGCRLGLRRIVDGTAQQLRSAPQLGRRVDSLLAARDGSLWVGTWDYPYRLAPEQWNGTTEHAAPGPETALIPPRGEDHQVNAICEDREGTMWFGLTQTGLTQIRRAGMVGFGSDDGLTAASINSVIGDGNGGLHVGAARGLFHSIGGRFEPDPAMAALGTVCGLFREADGTLWAGTSHGLARLRGGELRVYRSSDGLSGGVVLAIARDAAGNLWIGNDAGLLVLAGDRITVPPFAEALRNSAIRTIVEADDRALWVGGHDLLARIDAGRQDIRVWRSGSEIPFGEVRVILPAASGPNAWIAVYGGGLARVAGDRCSVVDELHGLFDQTIAAVVPVDDRLLVSSNRGIFSLQKADLDAVADRRQPVLVCRPIANAPGFNPECNGWVQPSAFAQDGKVWFCAIDSVLAVDTTAEAAVDTCLPCHVEEVIAGEDRLPDGDPLRPALGLRSLSFRLGACAFDNPEATRFRWRLLGRDAAWTPPTLQREARFARLEPGDYTFEAEAISIDGKSSIQPVRLRVEVPAYLWETAMFRIGAALAVIASALLLLRFGAARAAARAAGLQQRVDERTRELQAARASLEDRVRARTEELRQALARQHADTAERQRLESQLQQLQRMESVGQLAGGIAHDFNNVLTVVLGCGSLIERDFAGTTAAELAGSIRDAGERGRRLTQHLLAVASRQVVKPELLDLNRLLADFVPMLHKLLGESVELAVTPSSTPALVRAATTQIEQILLNLAGNARDAMPRGGRLAITIAAHEGDVTLQVTDTGTGMAPGVRERVFDPFFTTKAPGAGAGLGLTTVYGITKQLGGGVQVDSEPGRGSTFVVRLPRRPDVPEQVATTVDNARPAAPSACSRVLLIEDDAPVRTVLQRLLERLGCDVTVAANGGEAVSILQDDPAAIDVVLSDVVMPGLQGIELVHALRAERTGLPIVFLSGYLEGKGTYQDLLEAGLVILSKPPVAAEVAAALTAAVQHDDSEGEAAP